jgi:Response regulator receiver domain
MGQAQPKRRTALIVEDDAELRILTAALLEEEQLDTIECESAEAALAVLLIGGQDIAMIFADVRLPGAMDGIDLAWEVKLRGRESRIPALASKDRCRGIWKTRETWRSRQRRPCGYLCPLARCRSSRLERIPSWGSSSRVRAGHRARYGVRSGDRHHVHYRPSALPSPRAMLPTDS